MQRQQNATARPVVPGKPILSQVRWPSSDRGADVSPFPAVSFAKLECCLIFAPVNATMSQKHSLLQSA